ncbi:hypothetical protein HYALB_00010245 [Hymenoscyphus albidus]|uniref:E3 SUMO-protein ligase pli1 n=1 Tax=Hymenoscyphus albidus TaxID=595503 RepID=A0A9N9LP24_9HELO|nr:hypothetical protein HYALB_00010245 [Hymenoscyphus albidus]
MTSMGGSLLLDAEPLVRAVQTSGMLNKTLIQICANDGLPKTGVKLELQQRIIERIRLYAHTGNVERFNKLKGLILNPPTSSSGAGSPYHSGMASSSSPARTGPAPVPSPYISGLGANRNGYNMGGGANAYLGFGQPKGIEFKSSPFFDMEQQLGETVTMDAMAHHRNNAKIVLKAQDYPILGRIKNDPSLKVMIFCAGENKGPQDVAFPHQSEIKVNTGAISANLRGLKNKPGSTRPVDITKDLRLTPPTYSNTVEMTYALTNKVDGNSSQKFYLAIHVVKTKPIDNLLAEITAGRHITEKAVLDEMVTKSRDPDIVATASVLSLKCPLSTLRISLPVRSLACRHNACFDGESYLQLQQQGPTWLCPICNQSAPFRNLVVDDYVLKILKNTKQSTDQVTVQPDGKWEDKKQETNKKENTRYNGVASDDDDDLVEITKNGDNVSMGAPNGYLSQPQRSVSTSSAGRTQGSTSSKRPIADVIDLTSSGDEDEGPARTPKRQQTNGYSTTSIPAYRPAPPSNAYR